MHPSRRTCEQELSLAYAVADAIQLAQASAPYRSWDAPRVSAPRSVRWHLAPPDPAGARIVRRTGWIAQAGRQAGVAACGVERGPKLLTIGPERREDVVWKPAVQQSGGAVWSRRTVSCPAARRARAIPSCRARGGRAKLLASSMISELYADRTARSAQRCEAAPYSLGHSAELRVRACRDATAAPPLVGFKSRRDKRSRFSLGGESCSRAQTWSGL